MTEFVWLIVVTAGAGTTDQGHCTSGHWASGQLSWLAGLELRWLSNQRLGANAKRLVLISVRDAISSTPFRSQRSERCF